jgi:hypothetical protein
MIVVNKESLVLGEAPEITRVDAQGEENLIKVNIHPDQEYGFYYIGTDDRDEYLIIDVDSPNPDKQWKYIDGEFEEIIQDPLE